MCFENLYKIEWTKMRNSLSQKNSYCFQINCKPIIKWLSDLLLISYSKMRKRNCKKITCFTWILGYHPNEVFGSGLPKYTAAESTSDSTVLTARP